MRRLIINADDFGLSKSINEGISRCVHGGMLNSVSVVSGGCASDEALLFIKQNTSLDVGVHLILTEERPLLSKDAVPSLVERNGRFPKTWGRFILLFCIGKIKILDIELELGAQINKILKTGIKITHLDSHCHIHVFPPILDLVIKMAKLNNISYVRVPVERITFKDMFSKRWLKIIILAFFSFMAKKTLSKHNIRSADFVLGVYNSGNLNLSNLYKGFRAVSVVDSGIFELVCHPGTSKTNLDYPKWGYHWEEETRLLTSAEIKRLAADWGIVFACREAH
jgi:predicted glycoside hydrolase/deacetylase ChbG (UPF0249 family)